MSQEEVKKALRRLERIKQDVSWALEILDDPTKNLQEDLTQEEADEISKKFHTGLYEMKTTLSAVSKKGPLPIYGPIKPPPVGSSKRTPRQRTGGHGPIKPFE